MGPDGKQAIDMLDNEFVMLKFYYEVRRTLNDKAKEQIGLKQCPDDNFLSNLYSKKTVKSLFGSLYCFNDLEQH